MEIEAQPFNLDLENYFQHYSGHAKIERLLFVAKVCAGQPLELESLRIALREIKLNTINTVVYRDVVSRLNSALGAGGGDGEPLDSSWIDTTDHRFAQQYNALEAELNIARSNLVKESIRLGHAALGELLYSRGEVAEAFRQFLRSRDYCTTPAQTLQLCINVIRCAIEMKNYMHVSTYVQKVETLPDPDSESLAKVRASQGVAYLSQRKYKMAAESFTNLPCDLGTCFSDVLLGSDVAIYGTLCALATMERNQIASRIIDSAIFRELLNQAPVEIREAAANFHASKYGAALRALDAIRPLLSMDQHIAEHIESLYSSIRARAISQYTKPFTSLSLRRMAEAFNTDEISLERDLVVLISSQQVLGRIDSKSRAFICEKDDVRASTYKVALDAAELYVRSTRNVLIRAGMLRHDLIQRPIPGERPERPERPERGEGPRVGSSRVHHQSQHQHQYGASPSTTTRDRRPPRGRAQSTR